jgi:hypothetical protein
MDAEDRVYDQGSLLIDDGKIVWVGEGDLPDESGRLLSTGSSMRLGGSSSPVLSTVICTRRQIIGRER